MTARNGALWFYDNGIRVFPVKDRDKTPACKSWDDYVPADRSVVKRFTNYGVPLSVLGVADSDSVEAEHWAQAHLPRTPFMVATARGVHRYYRIISDHPHFFHRDGLTIEFRHGRGQYVIGPGSIHATGARYTPTDWSWDIGDLPVFPPDFLFDDRPGHARGSLSGEPLKMSEQVFAGERHDVLFRLLRSLQARGVPDDAAIAACQAENLAKCQPPIDSHELDQYLRRVSRYGNRADFERIALKTADDGLLLFGKLTEAGVSVAAALIAARSVAPDFDSTSRMTVEVYDRVVLASEVPDDVLPGPGTAADGSQPESAAAPATTVAAPQPGFPLTESGDAEHFAHLYRDNVRYDHRRGRWLISNETSGIWIPDPVERLNQMAVRMARSRQRDANKIQDKDERAAAWHWGSRARDADGSLTRSHSLGPSHRLLIPVKIGTRTPSCSASRTAWSIWRPACSERVRPLIE